MKTPFIKFVNHASVILSNGNISILTDPWYFGLAFNNGWSLLKETNIQDIEDILNNIDYIWISHEHPDHFSIPFFKKFKDFIIKNDIKIIFQKTVDKRVIGFLNKNNIQTIELDEDIFFQIDKDFKIKIIKSDFYDSTLIAHINDCVIFNLNDCPIDNKKDLEDFKNKHGTCDILLSQFSYAAWKGGKSNIKWRSNAAKKKIDTIYMQSKILEARYTIPFASFIYFSNNYNFYMNTESNKINDLVNLNNKDDINLIVFKHLEQQNLNELFQNQDSITYWVSIYKNLNILPKFNFDNSIFFEELNKSFIKYQENIFKNNSKSLIFLLRKLPFFNFFSEITIFIEDINENITVDIFRGLVIKSKNTYDISMNSNSFNFLLNNQFGFDTLTVNACFEISKPKSFEKFTKFFALGNLNNLGISLNYLIFFNVKLIKLFFNRIRKVRKNIS